jgi:hypothetical protein
MGRGEFYFRARPTRLDFGSRGVRKADRPGLQHAHALAPRQKESDASPDLCDYPGIVAAGEFFEGQVCHESWPLSTAHERRRR